MFARDMLTLYREIRAASKTMFEKAVAATQDLDFDAMRVAKRLTVRSSGRTLIFDSETEQNAYMDFWFHEYRVNGKSLVASVDPVAAGLDALETEVLAAHIQASTSLYLTAEVELRANQILLRDLMEPEAPGARVTDIGLSTAAHEYSGQFAIFCRLVVVRGLTITTGFSLGFLPERVPGLLQGCQQRLKRLSPADLPEARFIYFYQKYQQSGIEQAFRDVK